MVFLSFFFFFSFIFQTRVFVLEVMENGGRWGRLRVRGHFSDVPGERGLSAGLGGVVPQTQRFISLNPKSKIESRQ